MDHNLKSVGSRIGNGFRVHIGFGHFGQRISAAGRNRLSSGFLRRLRGNVCRGCSRFCILLLHCHFEGLYDERTLFGRESALDDEAAIGVVEIVQHATSVLFVRGLDFLQALAATILRHKFFDMVSRAVFRDH